MNTKLPRALRTRNLLAFCIGVTLAHTQAIAQQAAAPATGELEEVIVTGFRASLLDSTDAKRESVGFVDTIFAEDIGKFPDTNIAESFQRIPGIQITREISGEGTTVAIRGLNTNFTKVLLNGAPVGVASSGQEGANANREVPLDLFPTELFSQLSVSKTATADIVEGGAAGTINMRMARPFDNEGAHLTYSIQGTDNNNADSMGTRGAVIASNTWGPFGALFGVTSVRDRVATEGFETVGWASMALSAAQCGTTCNNTNGNGPGTPTTVPDNASTRSAGLVPGEPIDRAWLLAHNPGLSIQQIDNAVIPRLGRPMFEVGDRERHNAVLSLELRPSEDLHLYLDTMYGKQENEFDRVDIMWGVRAGTQGGFPIPTNMQVDREDCSAGCVVTSGVFPNSLWMLEYRPYFEDNEFWGTNPGLNWQITDKLNLDVQGNFTKSEFTRESPTVMVISDVTTVTYNNNGRIPTMTSGIDINNPASFRWVTEGRGRPPSATNPQAIYDLGRVNVPVEEREAETTGARFALTWGDDALSLKLGGAYDEISRDIRSRNNDALWQAAVCGGNPPNQAQPPNSQPPCRGEGGSLVTGAEAPGYLRPTEYGFVTVNWDAFARDTNYGHFRDTAIEVAGLPTTASWGSIAEEASALFTQLNGDAEVRDLRLRYNVGVRYVKTDQSVTSRITTPDPRNASLPDGQRFMDVASYVELETEYENWLPSANVAMNVSDNAVVRAGLSRTMTRPNPTEMLLGLTIGNADVSQVNLGNPDLAPYISDNIDFGFEYYTGNEGYFGIAAFRKGIDGFTQRRTRTVTFGDLAQYGVTLEALSQQQRDAVNARGGISAPVQLQQFVNADGRLVINGLEFNWVQPLDFLLEGIGLDGFGFTANYTIIDQKGSGAAPAIAIGVPPESYNATLYYDNHGVSARISVTHSQGSQNSGPGSNQQGVTGAELFGDDFTQWDFSSSFDLGEMFGLDATWVPQVTVDVININEEERRAYQQFSNATFSLFDSGRTIIVGVRGRF